MIVPYADPVKRKEKNREYQKAYYQRKKSHLTAEQKERKRAQLYAWRENNREKMRAYNRAWYAENLKGEAQTPKTLSEKKKKLWYMARSRAKARGIDFDFEIDDIEWPDKCPVFGIDLDYFVTDKASPNSPSLDRTDSSKGYVRGNVRVISWRANVLKKDATTTEMIALGEYARRVKSENDQKFLIKPRDALGV